MSEVSRRKRSTTAARRARIVDAADVALDDEDVVAEPLLEPQHRGRVVLENGETGALLAAVSDDAAQLVEARGGREPPWRSPSARSGDR
jgi:hypothetical protein